MKYNKLRAFTLAEVMVLLLTLSILAAAFAPVFTTRYTGGATDEVWTYVAGDDNYDAYYDVVNKKHTAQAFIGITPISKIDVPIATANTAGKTVYSKLIIRASDRLSPAYGGQKQNQIQFRYGDSAAGDLVGSLFAGEGNFLLGGSYFSLTANAKGNTSFGSETMSSLTSGQNNTAAGAGALYKLENGSFNTAVGVNAGYSLKNGVGNTFIGNYSGESADTGAAVKYNTFVGNNSGKKVSGTYNTGIGYNSLSSVTSGNYNSALGYNSLKSLTTGSYNTAVGYHSLSSLTTGSYNTALGYNSCVSNKTGSYVTCIGFNSGSRAPNAPTSKLTGASVSQDPSSSLFSGTNEEDEVVLIGSLPVHSVSPNPGAVLEVHNKKTDNAKLRPIPGGNESVVINGNLIVRGRSYLETTLARPSQQSVNVNDAFARIPKGLVAYTLFSGQGIYAFGAYDGSQRSGKSHGRCDRYCKSHLSDDIRKNCICTAVGKGSGSTLNNNTGSCYGTDTVYPPSGSRIYSSTSYDWATSTGNNYNSDKSNCKFSIPTYTDASTNCKVTLEKRGPNDSGKQNTVDKNPGSDFPLAHGASNIGSCCPDLRSDIRLKNVGSKFTAGLDELRRLKVYNYTFKNDPNNSPHVGVIAQDLKLIFPTAVSKDEKGYYKIRWDEMFYAAINSIKTLNTKIEKLASKVATDKERISTLKRDNAELNLKLDSLVQELDQIEAKKK